MALAKFILDNMESILGEWEEFAKSMPPAAGMDPKMLRDHAERMLETIAEDMQTPQNEREREAKSKGQRAPPAGEQDTPAARHGGGRFSEGFNLDQTVAEYRALRASVIRLWSREVGHADRETLDELVRFNEGIDQAITESTGRYSIALDRSRELFLGVLGHDLRNPLGAVKMSAHALLASANLRAEQVDAASRIVSSTTRMERMISDLLDVTGIRLGGSLPMKRAPMDLGRACRRIVAEIQASHPNRQFRLSTAGDLSGSWDEGRIHQLLSNIVENAVKYGSTDAPVSVSVHGAADHVVMDVHNEGEPIPASMFGAIFEPLARGDTEWSKQKYESGLGLGLYIAREIARAHHGSIDVGSSEQQGTTFTVRLPRAG